MKTAIAAWTGLLACMGALFWLSSLPQAAIPGGFTYSDKFAHAGAYFGLCLVAQRAGRTVFRRVGTAALFAFCVSAAYGAFDEWRQSLTPGRSSDIYDWAADLIGAAMAVGLTLYLARRAQRRSNVEGG